MKIAIIGQQDFGKAVLEAFLARGDQVAAVFCAPEKEGARPDSLRVAAQEKGLKVHQFKSLKAPEAVEAMKAAGADIGIMAFVLQFAPQEFVRIPKHGTIQYHPSLLPKYRGPSSINWPISRGEKETGLTIFRPTDGLDEGAVVLQKKTPVGENDTLGSVYFDRLFPMGVQAMLEAADLVTSNRIAGLLRRLVPRGRGEDPLGQPRRFDPQPDPRRRPGAGGLDHPERRQAAAV
jgi:methionyl-tRNA formyltransferase